MNIEFNHDPDVIEEVITDIETTQTRTRDLVLYNDDYHTFDFVIEALINICDHDLIQAEQCTHIVHNNGKCVVKSGAYTKLNPMRVALCDRGLSAVIN